MILETYQMAKKRKDTKTMEKAASSYAKFNRIDLEDEQAVPYDLILAIQTAGVVRGRNGFRKDKGGEKLDETEENLLEHRTDGTDAFDTLFIGCEKFPQRNFYPISASGIL